MARLNSDPKLEACCTFLDWDARRMAVPQAYRVFTEQQHFVHKMQILQTAMNRQAEEEQARESDDVSGEGELGQQLRFPWQEVMYRDYFDRFFEYLSEMHGCVAIGLIEGSDIEPLRYWVEKVTVTHEQIFSSFLKTYRYERSLSELKKLFHAQ